MNGNTAPVRQVPLPLYLEPARETFQRSAVWSAVGQVTELSASQGAAIVALDHGPLTPPERMGEPKRTVVLPIRGDWTDTEDMGALFGQPVALLLAPLDAVTSIADLVQRTRAAEAEVARLRSLTKAMEASVGIRAARIERVGNRFTVTLPGDADEHGLVDALGQWTVEQGVAHPIEVKRRKDEAQRSEDTNAFSMHVAKIFLDRLLEIASDRSTVGEHVQYVTRFVTEYPDVVQAMKRADEYLEAKEKADAAAGKGGEEDEP